MKLLIIFKGILLKLFLEVEDLIHVCCDKLGKLFVGGFGSLELVLVGFCGVFVGGLELLGVGFLLGQSVLEGLDVS
jgi:hypothetical protein